MTLVLFFINFSALRTGLRTDLETTCDLIVVSGMVQNIAAKRNEPLIPIHEEEEGGDGNSSGEEDDGETATDDVSRATQYSVRARGQAFRDRIVQNYF
jgi:hypothetical protein